MFETCMDFVEKWEGGWANDKADPGGLTYLGVTIRTVIAKGLDFNGDGIVNADDLRAMTKDQARALYRSDYWDACRCDDLPDALALLVFNSSVNQGPGRAARFLQTVVGTAVDGQIGPATLAATQKAWAASPAKVIRRFAARQVVHYSSLSIATRFGLGWYRRLFDAAIVAAAIQGGTTPAIRANERELRDRLADAQAALRAAAATLDGGGAAQ